jgi:ATP-binding cassette subfamily A (ABC1) protein 3
MFARIKGVGEDILAEYVEHLIARLGLQEGIADKPTKGYSGGNKRKLCVGIALIGNPPIVFLDEPSTGMDPGSRRFMWDLIASTMKHRSVILTTHSYVSFNSARLEERPSILHLSM